MKKKFKCSCRTHLLEINYETKDKIPEIWIGIYDIYSPKTGRKYKKPRLIADTWFLGCQPYVKDMDFLMDFLENIVMTHITRRK